MRLPVTCALLFFGLATGSAVTGCATSPANQACTVTPFISPTSVTLDHTAGSANLQYFNTGDQYAGNCAIPAIVIKYHWAVSDPVTATVAADGGVSCVASSLAPITVSSQLTSIDATGKTVYLPSNLPSATLTCK